jgi:hypothetical protein
MNVRRLFLASLTISTEVHSLTGVHIEVSPRQGLLGIIVGARQVRSMAARLWPRAAPCLGGIGLNFPKGSLEPLRIQRAKAKGSDLRCMQGKSVCMEACGAGGDFQPLANCVCTHCRTHPWRHLPLVTVWKSAAKVSMRLVTLITTTAGAPLQPAGHSATHHRCVSAVMAAAVQHDY